MTISTTSSSATYVGNGAATTFAFPFLVADVSHLVVTITDRTLSPNTITPLSSGQFGYTGIGNASGGTITLSADPATGLPLAMGKSLTIRRVVPYLQGTSIVNQDGFYPDVLESAFDHLTMCDQQLAEQLSRTIQVPVGSGVSPQSFYQSIMDGAKSAISSAAAASSSQVAAAAAATDSAATLALCQSVQTTLTSDVSASATASLTAQNAAEAAEALAQTFRDAAQSAQIGAEAALRDARTTNITMQSTVAAAVNAATSAAQSSASAMVQAAQSAQAAAQSAASAAAGSASTVTVQQAALDNAVSIAQSAATTASNSAAQAATVAWLIQTTDYGLIDGSTTQGYDYGVLP